MDQQGRLWSLVACFVLGAVLVSVAGLSFRFYFPHRPVAVASPNDTAASTGGSAPANPAPRYPAGFHVDQVYAQRSQIRQLRALLDQKTALLEKKTTLLNEKNSEHAALEAELAQAAALLEMLSAEVAAGDVPPQNPSKTEQLQAELQRLQSELKKFESAGQQQQGQLEQLMTQLVTTDRQIAAIVRESDAEINALLAAQRDFEQAAMSLVSQTGAAAVPGLIHLLAHPRAEVRAWSARSLGTLGGAAGEATPALIDALSDADPRVQTAARAALDALEAAAN